MASKEEYQTLVATLENLKDVVISQMNANDDGLAAHLSNDLDVPFDKIVKSIEVYRAGTIRLCPPNKTKIVPKPSQQNLKDLKDLKDLTKADKATIVLNYGPNAKSHALFGDFKIKHAKFRDEFLNPTSWIRFSRLAFGPGWMLIERDRLGELKKSLKKFNVPWQEIEYKTLSQNLTEKDSSEEDIPSEPKKSKNSKKKEPPVDSEEDPPSEPKKSKKKSKKRVESSDSEEDIPEIKKSKKKSKKKECPIDSDSDSDSEDQEFDKCVKDKKKKNNEKSKNKSKKKVESSDSEEDPPSEPKKSKKDKLVVGEKLSTNQYGNLQEKKFGIIFVKLPVGKKNRMVNVAVGNQDTDTKPSKKYRGLKTVKCLTDAQNEECEDRAWTVLSEDMVDKLEEDEEHENLAAELRLILQTGDDSDSESDDSGSDDSDDSDDSESDDSGSESD